MKKILFIPLTALCLVLIFLGYLGFYVAIDVEASVIKVQDGDTFESSIGWIRLADIDSPESSDQGYDEAREFLSSMIVGKKVYLSIHWFLDQYERQVCLVYIRTDKSHLMNVNLQLVREGHAVIDDLPNIFYPNTWTLHVYYPSFLESYGKSKLLLYLSMIAVAGLIIATIVKIFK